jgi:hypothetical protein
MARTSSTGSSVTCRQVQRSTRQPATIRRLSRLRSFSKAAIVACERRSSVSTIRRAARQRKSASNWAPSTRSGTLTSGGGSPALRQSARNLRSSPSLARSSRGSCSAIARRNRATPRRPRFRSMTSRSDERSKRRRTSASVTTLRSSVAPTTPARSSKVRATEVQGMPSGLVVRSWGPRESCRCAWIPFGIRPRRPGAVISMFLRRSWRTPHIAAADRCETTARGPHASAAARNLPSRVSSGWPTA